MNNMQLYQAAVSSRIRYQESGEELTDFDEFMDELEKEYVKGQE